MPIVSIAMPAYNAEKYISDAIDSVIAQTYTNWELIICDDCSTDNTISIIEDYQKEHSNIKLIKRATNSGGCRLPRFDAIIASEGEFICPIDSDDAIEDRYLEKLINRQQETNADIILSRMIICNENLKPRKTTIPSDSYNMNILISGKEAIRETIGGWRISMAGLMCKTSIYKKFIKENYESNYNGGFADEIDHRKLLLCASTISITDVSYYYRQQPNSIVHSISATSYDSLNACASLLDFVIETFNDDRALIVKAYDEYLEKLYRAQQRFLLHSVKYSNEEKKYINQLIKQHYNSIKRHQLPFNSKRNKILSISFSIFKLYTWIFYNIIKLKK